MTLLLILAAPMLGATPTAVLSKQAALASWNSWFGTISRAAVNASLAPVTSGTCTSNWDAFVAARTNTYSCTDSSYDCSAATCSVQSDCQQRRACCYEVPGHKSPTGTAFWTFLPLTGMDPTKTDSSDTIDEPCKEWVGNGKTGEQPSSPLTEDERQCCFTCADTSSLLYPATCTAADYAAVAVCASSDTSAACTRNYTCADNTELPLSPLPAGWKCDTAPAYGSTGQYEVSEDTFNTPDCTQLDSDFAASTSGATIWASVEAENTANAYGQMRKGTAFVERAVLAGGEFFLSSAMKCGVFLEPVVGTNRQVEPAACTLALKPALCCCYIRWPSNHPILPFHPLLRSNFAGYDASGLGSPVAASTVSTMDVRIYNPKVLATAGKSLFSHGSVMVVGGTSAGELDMGQYTTKAELSGLTNTGTVRATGASDIFIADTVSSGSVSVTDSTAVLVDITNSGNVSVSGGTSSLYEITNAAAGTVHFLGGTVTLDAITTAGTVTMLSGTVTGTAITNTGSINIMGGVIDLTFTDNAGGALTIAAGVTGTITLSAGGSSGTCNVPATVTTVGFSCAAPPSPPVASPAASASASPPPSPPPPVVSYITTAFTVSGDVSDYDEAKQDGIKQVLATAAGVAKTAVELTIASASVKISATITAAAVDAATTTATLSAGILANSSALESALASGGVSGVVVATITESPAVAASPPPPPFAPPPTSGSDSTGAIVGGVVGGISGPLFGAIGYYVYKKKRASQVKVTTSYS